MVLILFLVLERPCAFSLVYHYTFQKFEASISGYAGNIAIPGAASAALAAHET
jgi:hypothetical protein